MSTIFTQEEINTGRQREFDYLKGIFMLFIYLIHAFQATFSVEDSLTRSSVEICRRAAWKICVVRRRFWQSPAPCEG